MEKAEGAFKQAVAFAKMRYGRNEKITTEKLALVYNMMELSPRPNLEMIAPLMAKTENFLEQEVPDAGGMSDEFVDKVVDFVWEAIPDVMLESIIDAYAHMKKQLDAYFQQVGGSISKTCTWRNEKHRISVYVLKITSCRCVSEQSVALFVRICYRCVEASTRRDFS